MADLPGAPGRAPAATGLPVPLVAALWMLGAIVSFSLMAIGGREMAVDLDTFEIMTYRSAIGLVLVLGFGIWRRRLHRIATRRPGMHLVRNLFHFTGQNLWFYALALIPLAQVFAIEFTVPIWVALLAPLVLGEHMTRARLLAALLGFLGVLVVTRPGVSDFTIGHAAVVVAAFCFAGSFMSTKRLSGTETVWTILFWMTFLQTVMGLGLGLADLDFALPPANQLPWIAVVGFGGLIAHLCIATALSRAPATVVAPMDFMRLPLIAVIGMAVYGEALDLAVFAGAALIIAGNLLNLRDRT
ncbi:MAG: DMT family transporter [Azospirillaceae bacterium]